MLQHARPQLRASSEPAEQGLDLTNYIQILKRRFWLIIIPAVLIFCAGFAIALLLPPIYMSQGRILVESQQIPTELVRPTITATARERIQVIEQRVLSRENLVAVADKFDVFGPKRKQLSGTEVYDLMRLSAKMQPFELDSARRRDGLTIALTVSFEHERPDIATRVANELMTLVLREDANNRTNRATETTRFLAREVRKHEEDLKRLDARIAELRQRNSEQIPEKLVLQLMNLRGELAAKSTIFSEKHPDILRIKQQIEALEKLTSSRTGELDAQLDALQAQRTNVQKGLDEANQKLGAAKVGESLERDQFSERLEILEQAVAPQKPIKPNRLKIIAMSIALAGLAGLGCAFVAETADKSIRRRQDLQVLADGALVVSIPYIATKAELRRRRRRLIAMAGTSAAMVAAALIAVHFLLRPLDEIWDKLVARLLV